MRSSRLPFVLLVSFLLFAHVGCQGAPQAKTPEQAFAHLQKAAKNKSYKQMFAVMTPKGVEMTAAEMLQACQMASMVSKAGDDSTMPAEAKSMRDGMKNALAAAKKYGVSEEQLSPTANPQEVLKSIKDKAGFTAAVMKAILDSAGPERDPFNGLAEAELSDVKIDGDSATGIVKMNGREQSFSFEKIDGVWLINPPGM